MKDDEKIDALPEGDQKVLDRLLYDAVNDYAYDRIDLAVRKGANIDSQHENGFTPLMAAINKNSDYLVGRVLKNRPNLFVRDQWQRTAFDIARNISDSNTRGKIITAMLETLPDRIRKEAANDDEAIRKAEEEAKQKKPVKFAMPEPASFKPKAKGFNP